MKKKAKKKSKTVRHTGSAPEAKSARNSGTRATRSQNESRQSVEESRDFPDAIYLDR